MTLKVRGGERERLSYRTLDVEQIGSVYETVMGFTVEAAKSRVLAIKAGKNNKTPVFVALDELLAKKGKDRIKDLKENAGRGQLCRRAGQGRSRTRNLGGRARGGARRDRRRARFAAQCDRASRHARSCSRPDERRRTGSHYTPRSLTAPIVKYALEPAFERLGPDATPEQVLDLKVCDPAMGSGAFLVEACRAIGRAARRGLGALAGDAADDPGRRGRGASCPPARRAALPLWRRQEPARRRSRPAVAVARDAGAGP